MSLADLTVFALIEVTSISSLFAGSYRFLCLVSTSAFSARTYVVRVGIFGPNLSSGAVLLWLLPTVNFICDSPFLPYTRSFSICGCAVINLDSSFKPGSVHDPTSQSFSISFEGDPANDHRCASSKRYNQVQIAATQSLPSNKSQSYQTRLGVQRYPSFYLWPIRNGQFQSLDYHGTLSKSVH